MWPEGAIVHDDHLFEALGSLTGLQLYVVAGVDVEGLTESQVAAELTASRGEPYTRDRVHRIRLTAHARLRRSLEAMAA
jgi:hypothetical protein